MTHLGRENCNPRIQCILIATFVLLSGSLFAQATLEDIFDVAKQMNEDAIAAQAQIDDLDDEIGKAVAKYESALQAVDGQKVVNRSIQLLVNRQNDELQTLNESIEEVTSIQRDIVPLMFEMVEALDQLVANDLPFLYEVRTDRVLKLRDMLTDPGVSNSEKFSQILRGFRIESEYGRTMDATRAEEFEINGNKFDVDILRVGRIALMYQTTDGKHTGWWNPAEGVRDWEELDNSYTAHVRNGLKMANKTMTGGLFRVPVLVPGE